MFITIAGAGAAGGIVGYFVRKNVAESKIATAEETAIRIIQEAEQTGEAKRKEALMEAKEEIHRLRSEMERENKERRSDLQRQERRLLQKEENLDRKIDSFEKKEEHLALKETKSYTRNNWANWNVCPVCLPKMQKKNCCCLLKNRLSMNPP